MSYFEVIMHQNRFPLGLRPRPRWGAYSAPTDSLAGYKGAPLRQGRGKDDLLQSLREIDAPDRNYSLNMSFVIFVSRRTNDEVV